MPIQKLITQILERPDAPKIIQEVSQRLEEEAKKRKHFYDEISEYEKAEFINGEIIIHSPVKKEHNDVSSSLHALFSAYVKKHQLGYLGYEKIMISLSRNDYEPDICFFKAEKAQDFKKGQSLFPAPDLVVEVLSPKTASNDRGIKYEDYQAHGILEYWIIDPSQQLLEQYRLNTDQQYELILKAHQGKISSEALL
ncbi:MAG: Uma2 family endonuclease, partial [Bacteroidota bacterium]